MKPRRRRDELLKNLLMFLLKLKLKLKLRKLLLGQRLLLLPEEVMLLTKVLMDKPSLHLQIIPQGKLSSFLFPLFQSYEQWVPLVLRLLFPNNDCLHVLQLLKKKNKKKQWSPLCLRLLHFMLCLPSCFLL